MTIRELIEKKEENIKSRYIYLEGCEKESVDWYNEYYYIECQKNFVIDLKALENPAEDILKKLLKRETIYIPAIGDYTSQNTIAPSCWEKETKITHEEYKYSKGLENE